MKYLFYAYGKDTESILRGKAFFNSKKINEKDVLIMSNSPYASMLFTESNIVQIPDDKLEYPYTHREFISETILENNVTEVIIDTFPCGFDGEFNGIEDFPAEVNYNLLARHLDWNEYKIFVQNPLPFNTVYLLEELESEQNLFIMQVAKRFERISLDYPDLEIPEQISQLLSMTGDAPVWIVSHIGKYRDLERLYEHAQKMARKDKIDPVFIVTPRYKEMDKSRTFVNATVLDLPYSYPLYEKADKFFTDCNFNDMQFGKIHIKKHEFRAQLKKFDNQFQRALTRKNILEMN